MRCMQNGRKTVVENNKKYRLVILGSDWDLYKVSYSEVIHGSTLYLSEIEPKNKFLNFFYKLHLTPKVNRFVSIPYKNIWCRYWFRKLDRKEPTIFLVFRNWIEVNHKTHIFDFIKKNFGKNKVVIFFQDIIDSYKNPETGEPIDIQELKSKTDLLISYDINDSQKYEMLFHPTVFSQVILYNNQKPKSDIFFVGKDKGRLKLLGEIYKKLTNAGFKCIFIVLKVPKEHQILRGEIQYIDSLLSYKDTLEYVEHTKCILELMQPGAVGSTYRVLEAISFNKKLLSNNVSMCSSDYYDSKYVQLFQCVNDIDLKFLTTKAYSNKLGNPLKDKISPVQLVSFIEQELSISIK